jgi:hypothetical protein
MAQTLTLPDMKDYDNNENMLIIELLFGLLQVSKGD